MTRLFIDSLTVIDFAYLHPERGLLGESWLLDLELDGTLDHQGMVLDFGLIKQRIKQRVDDSFDHRLLVPLRYPGTQVKEQEGRCHIHFRLRSGEDIRHSGPANASCLLDADAVSPDSLTEAISTRLRPQLPDNVTRIDIRLRREERDGACYQVSHGLRQHTGNCQRIAHGHRSCLEIFRDGRRDPGLEVQWASRWRDIYIGTRADLAGESKRERTPYYHFHYQTGQGEFDLELPRERCYLIDTDSTVENLAWHIADTLKREHPKSSFRVRAFEGVGKGAIAEI